MATFGTSLPAGNPFTTELRGRMTNEESRRELGRIRGGLPVARLLTRPGHDVYATLEWERRDAIIRNEKGETIFEQRDVEVPRPWSQMATSVVVSKYFRGILGTRERETSVRQLVGRVVGTLVAWGLEDGYFRSEEDAAAFHDELAFLLLHQYGAFNSPVWFNLGVEAHPQCSACFINAVDDTMESILDLAKVEGMLFKFGSGTGTNLSSLRSSREPLRGGGQASGPVSFMRGFDAFAGVIKSGGKTRRAAKMVILDIDHPDIALFIDAKANEEKKAWALIDAGYDGTFNGEAYSSVFFQNANNSVRVSDDFMRAVDADAVWETHEVTTGRVADRYRATDLLRRIAEASHVCGDPGMQFHTTINAWHTCPNAGPIRASNPCSEFMFLDNSACNLASLNLLRFLQADGSFDTRGFRHAVDLFVLAQEIVVDRASYPTEAIGRTSRDFRPLGLGYANLGALLMALGMPYDSDRGRSMAAAVTALMTGEGYRQSARIAEQRGAFRGYAPNHRPMLDVLAKHRAALLHVQGDGVPAGLIPEAARAFDEAIELGTAFGFRNAQVTLLAPTGTIAFMMDCDTTGVEPEMALVRYKQLVGGGRLKLVNQTVPAALRRLGYDDPTVDGIVQHIDRADTIEGAPGLHPEHLPVFDCAFRPRGGERVIPYMGHLKMMAAVQPFLSGAISKTVNLPENTTVDDIVDTYRAAWRMGLKAVAIYRDNSKRTQPLMLSEQKPATRPPAVEAAPAESPRALRPYRRRLPDERRSITHKFTIGGHKGYLTVGVFEDGTPGELFVVMAKQGSVISGLMDSFSTAVSLALQYGVPLEVLVNKFAHTRFEPSGFTSNPEIPIAKSLVDYIFRWLALKFLSPEAMAQLGFVPSLEGDGQNGGARVPDDGTRNGGAGAGPTSDRQMELRLSPNTFQPQADAPPCPSCGSMMVRNGACYKCLNCGGTSGCS